MKKEKGQSLIEVVAAMGIILIAVVALLIIITISLRNVNFAKNQVLATKYAQLVIEKVRNYRDSNNWDTFTQYCESFSLNVDFPSYFLLERDCHIPDDPLSDCRADSDSCEVKITVSWEDTKGVHKSELTTYLNKWK